MTDEETIERGLHAEALLGSTVFQEALVALGDAYLSDIAASRPHEAELRETNYRMHRSLNDLVAQLHQFCAVKDRTIERLREQETNDDE